MLPQDKTAVIYGGGGHAGGAIARAFSREGAVVHLLRSKFLTSRAAARHMARQGSGLIMFLGGSFDWQAARQFKVGGMGVTFDAVESLRRQLAVELGPRGIRAVTLCTGGLPESIPDGWEGRDDLIAALAGQTLTGPMATLDDLGEVAAFVASDRARTITATAVNFS